MPADILPLHWPIFTFHVIKEELVMKTVKTNLILITKGIPVHSRVDSIDRKDSRVQHCRINRANLAPKTGLKRVNSEWYRFRGPDSASLKWGCFGDNFWH